MTSINILFTNGTQLKWFDVSKEEEKEIVCWLDDKENTKTFKINIKLKNSTVCLRKESILYIEID